MSIRPMARALAIWLAPLAMVVLAIRQHHLARTRFLSPWEGGGFGMFASADLPGARFLRLSITEADGSVHAGIIPRDPAFERSLRQIQAMPTPERVQALAKKLAARTWVPEHYDAFAPAGSAGPERGLYRCLRDGEPPPPTVDFPLPRTLELRVARRVFDPDAEVLRSEPLTRARVDLPVP